MFLFNVYMYVIYISTCIDIINSVYLLLIFNYGLVALVLCILPSSRRLLVNQGQQQKTTTTTIKKQKKSTANSLWL